MTALVGWVRGLLAVGLLAGFYVVALALLAADTVLVALVLWAILEAPARAGNWSLAIGGSIPAVFALVYGIATVSRAETHPPGAVLVRRAEAPGLWRLVEELARHLRTRPPGRVYLTPDANASVSEEARLLGFAVGRRTLYLGVPLLRLEPLELRAVLCHELGHYAGLHTRFGALTHRGAASLRSTLFRLRMTARSDGSRIGYAWLFQAVIGAYAWLYLRVSLAVRRRQELEADAEAVALAGPAATAGALRSVHALGITWAGFVSRFLRPVQGVGFVPEDVYGAFGAMLDDPRVRERTAALRAHPVEAGRSPLDSHPPLARRLALIEARPAGEPRIAVEAGPLLTDRTPASRVQRKLLAETGGPATALPTAVWAEVAAEAFAIEPASLLLDAAGGTDPAERPTLGTVLDLLEHGGPSENGRHDEHDGHGERAALLRRLTDAPDPEGQLAEALYALTGQALAGAGRARWVLSWTRGYVLECPQDPDGSLEALVTAAARDRTGVRALRGELARLGLDTGAPVVLALRTVAAPAGRTTTRRTARRAPDLVVEELRRQRRVARVTVGALVVTAMVWVAALIGADPYRPGPPPYRPVPPQGPLLPTVSAPVRLPDPGLGDPLPWPSLTVRLPVPSVSLPIVPLSPTG
ncbi:M48 family metalloprotease [Streptomyces tagetis]|uniref:M48 family metalloprotease n=1 Tax=Streptomyces tagetis TaxID=2820809 RepID=A0A940XFH5_9ACTN|nr:M48 family metallopeptidase [Streptomyces sp. RG38]MBQ0827524.1 M48 family metalloprotease [Streptomyces sp. RG38]